MHLTRSLHFQYLPCSPQPSSIRDLKVHHGQERIDPILLFNEPTIEFFLAQLTFILHYSGDHIYSILCSQFKDLHFLIDFHVPIFASHTSIEKFIEIDIAIVTFNAHF